MTYFAYSLPFCYLLHRSRRRPQPLSFDPLDTVSRQFVIYAAILRCRVLGLGLFLGNDIDLFSSFSRLVHEFEVANATESNASDSGRGTRGNKRTIWYTYGDEESNSYIPT